MLNTNNCTHNFREALHKGVLRDIESRQKRKAENIYLLQKQIDLTKELKGQDNNT